MHGNAWKLQVNIRPVFLYSNEAYRPNAQESPEQTDIATGPAHHVTSN